MLALWHVFSLVFQQCVYNFVCLFVYDHHRVISSLFSVLFWQKFMYFKLNSTGTINRVYIKRENWYNIVSNCNVYDNHKQKFTLKSGRTQSNAKKCNGSLHVQAILCSNIKCSATQSIHEFFSHILFNLSFYCSLGVIN